MKAARTIFIAIDPGASGAAAVKWTDGRLRRAVPLGNRDARVYANRP